MLELASGKIIDITTDRAKYHALRQHGIKPDSAHRKLYAVTDIVYRYRDSDGNPLRGWTEFDFQYSHYTLESVRRAKDWSDEDKIALSQWLQQDDQRRRIESARSRLVDHHQVFSVKNYSAPEYLFSALKRRLEKLPLQRATAAQWQATVNNMSKSGVRHEEISWTGLDHYLKQQAVDTVISKTELINHLNLKNIRLELNIEQVWGVNGGLNFKEVAQRMLHQPVYRAALKLDDSCVCVLRYVDSCYNYRVGVVKKRGHEHDMALNKYWFALDPYGRAIPNSNQSSEHLKLFFESSSAAKLAADAQAREHLGIRSGASTYTRFDHLSLYGGRDYREWTVSLPDFQRTFFGAHFYNHNVLIHIRTTARKDKNGSPILFIEEIQSDWHQSGKRYGYDNTVWGHVANAPFKKEWPALAAKLMLIHASQNGFAGIAWPRGDIQELRYGRELQAIKHHYDTEMPKALNRLGRAFNASVTSTYIETRDPWLNLEKTQDKWRVADGQGKFKTRAKYTSRDEAMAVITRHCRALDLEVPVFYLTDQLNHQIMSRGLPLFGEVLSED